MFINPEIEELILKRAIELDAKGVTMGVLDEKTLGGIMVYIDKVPFLCMYKIVVENDAPVLAGKTICAGADTLL